MSHHFRTLHLTTIIVRIWPLKNFSMERIDGLSLDYKQKGVKDHKSLF